MLKRIIILVVGTVLISGCVTTFKATSIKDTYAKSFEPKIHYVNTLISSKFKATAMVTRTQSGVNNSMAPAIHESFKNAFVNYSPFLNPVVEKEEDSTLKEEEYYVFTVLEILNSGMDSRGNPEYTIAGVVCVVRGDYQVFMSNRIVSIQSSIWTAQDAQNKAVQAYMDKFYEAFNELDFDNPPDLKGETILSVLSTFRKWYQ